MCFCEKQERTKGRKKRKVYLRVVNVKIRTFLVEELSHVDGRRLSGVASILLEGEAEQHDPLTPHGVEHLSENTVTESLLLVLVYDNHLIVGGR